MDAQLTQILAKVADGDGQAREMLWQLVYDELHQMAHGQAGSPGGGKTLQTTALVHEAYLRLLGSDGRDAAWANRKHFFAAAAEAMRRVCVDDARKRGRLKRGGGQRTVCGTGFGFQPVDKAAKPAADGQDPGEVLSVHEALDKLERDAPRQAQVVKLRYFIGLSIDEVAQLLEVAPRTVDSDWRLARAWLHRELSGADGAFSEPRPRESGHR